MSAKNAGQAGEQYAARYLEEKGFSFDEESIKHFSDGRVLVIYAKEQIGGFAIHLMQK